MSTFVNFAREQLPIIFCSLRPLDNNLRIWPNLEINWNHSARSHLAHRRRQRLLLVRRTLTEGEVPVVVPQNRDNRTRTLEDHCFTIFQLFDLGEPEKTVKKRCERVLLH